MILILLNLYSITGSYFRANNCSVIHESSVAIASGAFIAGAMRAILGESFSNSVKFDDNIFFYAILPPIIFSAGYNLKRKKFFQHFNYITLFGVVGTFVAFLSFSVLNFLLFELISFDKYNPNTGEYSPFKLSLTEILLFSSVMCCSDTVAAVSIIKFEE